MIQDNLFTTLAILVFMSVILVIFDVTIRHNIFYFQIQSFFVVLFGILFAIRESDILILIASFIGLISKVIVIPQALYYLQSRTHSKSDKSKDYLLTLQVSVIIGILIVSYLITRNITIDFPPYQATILLLGMAIFFLGLYKMVIKTNLIAQIISFITLENAISLLSITFAPKLPVFVEIGLLLIIVIAVAMMLTLSLSIRRMFNSFDTNKLTKLKD